MIIEKHVHIIYILYMDNWFMCTLYTLLYTRLTCDEFIVILVLILIGLQFALICYNLLVLCVLNCTVRTVVTRTNRSTYCFSFNQLLCL